MPDNGTFPYDGGPKQAVPMPGDGSSAPMTTPRGPAVAYDLLVQYTAPAKTTTTAPTKGKWTYPAYGETARRTGGSSR